MAAHFFVDRKGRTDAEVAADVLHSIEVRVVRRKAPPYAPDRVYLEANLRNPLSRRSLFRKDADATQGQPSPRPPSRPSPTQGSPSPRCDRPCCGEG